MLFEPSILIQESTWVEFLWLLEDLRVVQDRAQEGEDLGALGQGVPPEAGGPGEGAGYSHGHQCQQSLRLMQNRVGVWEAGSVPQPWRPARPQLPCQLLVHALCPQEEEG